MAAQAFFYNAIFFTYALGADAILWRRHRMTLAGTSCPSRSEMCWGPRVSVRCSITIGRKPMIAFTYATSGLLACRQRLAVRAWSLSATEQTIAWMTIFFFASAAAGAAYLTVSETFPVEIRALAIAVFYAAGTAIGGVGAPLLLGALIETGARSSVFIGYLIGAALMLIAAVVQLIFGVAAEGKSLEQVAQPLSSPFSD